MDPPRGPVSILWDMENCSIPSDVQPADVAINIRKALGGGSVTTFSAYGDFNSFPRTVREGCQRTGVKLIDVPNGRKDAADKAILVDMFLFALDNSPPSSIVLISGDVDFSHALHVLGQRGYTIILVIPSGVRVSPALCNAGHFVLDWPIVARGAGPIPSAGTLTPSPRVGLQNSGNQDSFRNEEAVRHQRLSQSPSNCEYLSSTSKSPSKNACVSSLDVPCSTSEASFESLASNLNKLTPALLVNQDDAYHLQKQSRDFNRLKGRLVKLLEESGGCLVVSEIFPQYQKLFDQPLRVTEYDTLKLMDLLLKFPDVMSIEGEGAKQIVYLKVSQACDENDNDKSLHLPAPSKENKRNQNMNEDAPSVSRLTDQLSDDNNIVTEKFILDKEEEKMDTVPTEGAVGEASKSERKLPASCSNPSGVSNVLWPASYVLVYGASKLGNLLQKFSDVRTINKQDEGKAIENVNRDADVVTRSSDKLSNARVAAKDNSIVEIVEEKTLFQLKKQLVKLLEHSGGCLALVKILPEYQLLFSQPLHISDYGACDLVNLLQKFSDVLSVEGEDSKEFVNLKHFQAGTTKGIALLSSLLKDEGGGERENHNVNEDSHVVSTSTDELTKHGVVPQENSVEGKVKEEPMLHLKGQLVKLLEQFEGCIDLSQIPLEFEQKYGQPLCVSDYGNFDFLTLLQEFSDAMVVEGDDTKKLVYLRKFQASLNTDEKGKCIQNANEDARLMSGSSDELSDYNKRAVVEEDSLEKKRQRIKMFELKVQLIKLLEQSGGCLAFSQIIPGYHKLFGRQLCLSEYGACKLMDLLQKCSSVIKIEGEGVKRLVFLNNHQAGTTNGIPLSSLSKNKEGSEKGIQNVKEGAHLRPESPEDKRVVVEGNIIDEKRQRKAMFRVKGQLIKLLEKQSGGCLALIEISSEFQKLYGWPLRVSEYGFCKVVDLLHEFPNVMTIKGEGTERMVYLKYHRAGTANAAPLSKPKEGSGKVNQNANEVPVSSDDKKLDPEVNLIEEKRQTNATFRVKGQLMKLLEQSGGCLAFNHIAQEYDKFYGRKLCVSEYGACKLVDLLQKFSNVMRIEGEGLQRMVYLKNYQDGISLLKMQVVELLKQSGGCLDLSQFRRRYLELFGKPLCISAYGACKLMDLLQKFSDVITVKGEAPMKWAYLKNYQAGTTNDIPHASSLSGYTEVGVCGVAVCE